MKKKILYLFSDTGGGHRSAASSLMAAVKVLKGDTIDQEAIDFFASGSSTLNVLAQSYAPMIRYAPWLWKLLWFGSNYNFLLNILLKISSFFILGKTIKTYKEKNPDVIVSVHPLVNHITAMALKKLDKKIPFITVVLDPINVHKSWIHKDEDLLIVATEEARDYCLSQGVPKNKLKMLGVPIDPKYADLHDKDESKEKIGLVKGKFTILIMGGGEGSGDIFQIAQELNKSDLDMQLIVVCGRNAKLKAKLDNANFRFPKKIYGFTYEVAQIMDASNMIITKGGPGSIFEALAKELPMIITSWLPGQEEGNIEFVEKHKVGKVEKDPKKIANAVKELLANKSIINNIREVKKPHAVLDIANAILEYVK